MGEWEFSLLIGVDDMRLENDYHTKYLKRIFTSLNNVTINAVSESMTDLTVTHFARQSFCTPFRFALSKDTVALKIGPWHS